MPSILIGIDDQGCINRWNRAAAETFGLEEADVLHKPLSRCGIHWLNSQIDAKIADLLQSQGRLVWDGVQFEKAGAPRLLGMTVTWIKVPHSRRGELLIVGSDITSRKRTEDELRAKTAFFEAQIQATIDGMLVVDEHGNILLHNERVGEIFEIPPELFRTQNDSLVLKYVVGKVADPSRFLERVKYLYSHRQEKGRDEVKLRNGRVLDRYSSPVFGPDGHYYGRIWSFHDITERKQNEDALRQLSVAVEQSPVSVLITDLEGNITYVNRRFTECTGYSYEEVIGRNPRLLRSEHTTSEEYRQLWQTVIGGQEWRGELCNKKKNGDLYWESVVISPIRNRVGETSHFLAVKEDITDRKIAENHSRQAQKLEAIGQLAAGIAHEINTPIQFVGDNLRFIKDSWSGLESLICFCESLQGNTLTADSLEQLRRILHESDSAYLRSEIPRALDQSLEGTSRVAKIVRAMKEFSHPGSDETQTSRYQSGHPDHSHRFAKRMEVCCGGRDRPATRSATGTLSSRRIEPGLAQPPHQRRARSRRSGGRWFSEERQDYDPNHARPPVHNHYRPGHGRRDPAGNPVANIRSFLYHQGCGPWHWPGTYPGV